MFNVYGFDFFLLTWGTPLGGVLGWYPSMGPGLVPLYGVLGWYSRLHGGGGGLEAEHVLLGEPAAVLCRGEGTTRLKEGRIILMMPKRLNRYTNLNYEYKKTIA